MITTTLTGRSGRNYPFQVYRLPVNFNRVGGVYAFSSSGSLLGGYSHYYIGQTGNLRMRLNTDIASHDGYACARRAGATHVLAMAVASEAERLAIEEDIILGLDPPCNRRLRRTG